MHGIMTRARFSGVCVLIAAVLTLGLAIDANADAKLSPAGKFVSRIANASMDIARRSADRKSAGFRELLARHGDVGPVALFALGPYAKSLPSGRRSEYYKLVVDFTATVFSSYSKEFEGAVVDVRGETERTGNFIVIDTRVSYGDGRPSRQLRWRVSARNGRYKVSDVSVAGFWLTLQLRSEFVSFLRKNNGNFEALFAALRRSSR